jgi:lactoylglutathione lyase
MITGDVGSPVTRQRRIEVGELLRWPGVPPMAQFKDRDGNTFEIVEASG